MLVVSLENLIEDKKTPLSESQAFGNCPIYQILQAGLVRQAEVV